MSDAYERVKGGRLTFKGGTLASTAAAEHGGALSVADTSTLATEPEDQMTIFTRCCEKE
ncbi:hypothetical protein HanIR_Chr06g0293671 [Helianthus annuus]|nr:hypothetical protein HanIR_Chr06g0293671 [Helianthus annuus]